MENKEELISQFTVVTGVERDRAQFYLESSAWQLEMALASFYENDGEDDAPAMVEEEDNDPEELPPKHTMATRKTTAQQKKPTSRFGTIASLNRADEASSDEEEGQAFYAGGSEHSGQQVLGPSKKKKDIVSEMFRSVQQHGAEVVDPDATSTKKAASFSGTGYRLGQTGSDSEVRSASSSRRESHSEVVLKLWKEGFSINDGEVRNYSDSENRDFLESVRRGEVPQELVREANGREVHLNMEDHRHEDFIQMSRPKVKAFTGKGHVLGSPSPAAVGITVPIDEKDRVANEDQAKDAVKVDPSLPATTVQIRLADGSRLVGRFNLTHTVADVRRYIVLARPQYEHQSFTLLTTFPSKELENNLTLDQAGLSNAAVLQRLI